MTNHDLESVTEVMRKINEMIKNNSLLSTYLQADDIHLLTTKETAKYLKIAETTVRHGNYPGKIKLNGVVYYDKRELNKALEEGRIK